jgi:hypothetical protein
MSMANNAKAVSAAPAMVAVPGESKSQGVSEHPKQRSSRGRPIGIRITITSENTPRITRRVDYILPPVIE